MAANSDKTIPIFTINHFPTELIVRFAPDLRPRTVSTLRLVSRRFRDVFSADRYYRSYLCYPDKLNLYRHDLEEIGDQEGKWKLLLEAEKRRLGNWRKGRPARVDTVEIPNDLVSAYEFFGWQGKTGEFNDHYMLSECRGQKIVLLNVTKAPILTVVDVSSYTSLSHGFAHLLPDQVLIDSGYDYSVLFNILNDGEKLSLEILTTIESNEDELNLSISGNSKAIHTYRSIHVRYKHESTDYVLKVWDLKRAVELESIDLRELLSPKCDLGLDQTTLQVRSAGYPYVVADLKKNDTVPGLVTAVVNVEEKQFLWPYGNMTGPQIIHECMFDGNYWFIVCRVDYPSQTNGVSVSVYDLRLRRTVEDYESCLIFQIESVEDVQFLNPVEFILYRRDVDRCEFVSIDGSEVSQRGIDFCAPQITIPYLLYEGFSEEQVKYQFGPFFIVKPYALSSMDMSGTVMFDWADLFRESGGDYVFVRDLNFHSLWKCVFKNKSGKRLKIFYF